MASFKGIKLVEGKFDIYVGSCSPDVEVEVDEEEDDDDKARRLFCESIEFLELSLATFVSHVCILPFINDLLFVSDISFVLLSSTDVALPIVINFGRIVPSTASS